MKIISILILCVCVAGCATHKPLTSLPVSDDEYVLSKEELSKKYTDIKLYEERQRGFSANFPLEENVVSHLGEPNEIKRDWWFPVVAVGTLVALSADPIVWGVIVAIRPDTPKTYYFKKEDYCIQARMDRTIKNGYEPYMVYWEWDDKQEACGD